VEIISSNYETWSVKGNEGGGLDKDLRQNPPVN